VETDLLNIFNEQGIEDPDFISTNASVVTHRSSACRQTANNQPCLRFNPLAGDVPVEGVHWRRTASFGQPTSADAYQLPRTYRVSLGVRF
jgi:hypothetical protein